MRGSKIKNGFFCLLAALFLVPAFSWSNVRQNSDKLLIAAQTIPYPPGISDGALGGELSRYLEQVEDWLAFGILGEEFETQEETEEPPVPDEPIIPDEGPPDTDTETKTSTDEETDDDPDANPSPLTRKEKVEACSKIVTTPAGCDGTANRKVVYLEDANGNVKEILSVAYMPGSGKITGGYFSIGGIEYYCSTGHPVGDSAFLDLTKEITTAKAPARVIGCQDA